MPPDPPDVREHWRLALGEYLARKERTRKLRAELAAARVAGKARRHADRLARLNRNSTEKPRATYGEGRRR